MNLTIGRKSEIINIFFYKLVVLLENLKLYTDNTWKHLSINLDYLPVSRILDLFDNLSVCKNALVIPDSRPINQVYQKKV